VGFDLQGLLLRRMPGQIHGDGGDTDAPRAPAAADVAASELAHQGIVPAHSAGAFAPTNVKRRGTTRPLVGAAAKRGGKVNAPVFLTHGKAAMRRRWTGGSTRVPWC
jgi:hypothetical protein